MDWQAISNFIAIGVSIIMVLVTAIIGLLQASMRSMVVDIKEKVNDICERNEKAHEAMWSRIHHHKHTDNGEVVISNN